MSRSPVSFFQEVRMQNTEVRMAKPCSVVARYDITNAPQLPTEQLPTKNFLTFAPVKQRLFILTILAAMLCSCTQREPAMPQPRPEPVEGQHELAAFDSLMQSQPDSAFSLIYDFYTTRTDLAPFDRHYADLLLSEALFKCDYEQTLRTEVQSSLLYFDSLAAVYPKNDDFTLLSARSHYMNGVGLMEADSVVEACTEYIKALEIMENRFDEKELVGQKAKFMALTYNRLGVLFSDQFMIEQAITCLKKSLSIAEYQCSNNGVSKTLHYLGVQYDIAGKIDSAYYYYNDALCHLNDTNNLIYRNIIANIAVLDFLTGNKPDNAFIDLKRMRDKSTDDDEKLTRNMSIGSLYFLDKQYDSSLAYLIPVFEDTTDFLRKLQSAECLGKIYEEKGEKDKAEKYISYLAKNTTIEYEKRTKISTLEDLFHQHLIQQKDIEQHNRRQSNIRLFALIASSAVLIFILLIIIIKLRSKKWLKKQRIEAEQLLNEKEEKHSQELQAENLRYEIMQKSLSGKLIKGNQELNQHKEKTAKLQLELDNIKVKSSWDSLEIFLEEDICKEILALVEGRILKREAKSIDNQDVWLNKQQLLELSAAVERHFSGFREILVNKYPRIDKEISQCYLYLLNLNDVQIAAVLGCDYTTIHRHSTKLKKVFGTEKEFPVYIRDMVL